MLTRLRRFALRLLNALRPWRAEPDLEREIAFHMALLEEDFLRRGLPAGEARLAARRAFGGVDQAKEMHRDARSFAWLDDARRDVRLAARMLARTPGFTAAAVLTLGIGIGGTSAVFSVCHAVLIRPLPFPDPERLVLVFEDSSKLGFPTNDIRPRDYAAWAQENDVFTSMAGVTDHGVIVGGRGEPERVSGRRVTRSFFDVLGVPPILGRVFAEREDMPGGSRVTILSHGFWLRRFGGDPGVVSRDVVLNGEPHTIVGVMPQDFQFLDSFVSLWVPAAFSTEELTHGGRYVTVVGRLKGGVDAPRARANLDVVAAGRASLNPRPGEEPARAVVVPFKERLSGGARRPLLVLLAAVGVVLLIACANLASLLLARAAARRQELALRGALGASRGRIVRQLLAESLALAAMGLVVGVALARWAFTFLEQLVPSGMTLLARPTLDWGTLVVAATVAVVTGVLFGIAPALQLTRVGAGEALKASGRTTSGPERARGGLVVAEVALTLVLLVAAGLLLQTMYRLRYADLGLRPEGLLTLRTVLPLDRYEEHDRRVAFYDRVLERVERLPGVTAAGYTTSVPLEWKGGTCEIAIEGQAPDPRLPYDVNHRQVSHGYLQALGVTLERGRHFRPGDSAWSQPVAIVNEALARQYWPDGDPVGRRIAIDPPGPDGAQWRELTWRTVVGVVGNVRQMSLDAPPRPEIYVPYRQFGQQPWFTPRDLVVRTTGEPSSLAAAVKQEIHAVDPALAVSNVRTLDHVLDEDVAARRVGTTLVVVFAAFALVLAMVGIYGVIAYFVVQHVPEMGIRLALGAGSGDIKRFVLRKGMALALMGVGIGALAALATTKALAGLLYEFSGNGITMCAAAAAVLLTLAFVASYLPARRATEVDPITALRSE
jgi:predicted permease